jgi:type II secretory pathway pseudopilin PulG
LEGLVDKSSVSRPGFTLIEALVASVLLGVGVVGLLSAAVLSMRNSQRAEFAVTGMNLAREKMAEVQVKGPAMWMLGEKCNGQELRGEVSCEWSIAIEELTPGELHDVIVTVDWQAASTSGRVELETLLNDFPAAAVERLTEQKNPLEGTMPSGPGFNKR